MDFNELEWHDAELIDIYIDRALAGKNDTIKITIKQANDKRFILIFTDCFALNLNMNFGIIAPENILDARISIESESLSNIRNIWSNMGVDLKKIKCFQFETNSTNSLIQIFALSYEIKSVSSSHILEA